MTGDDGILVQLLIDLERRALVAEQQAQNLAAELQAVTAERDALLTHQAP